jgi:hypothetical protein
MANARCERCGMPHERDKTYSTQPYLPVGYPSSGVTCGRTICRNPAFAWLTLDEEKQCRDKGERIFSMNTAAAKIVVQ